MKIEHLNRDHGIKGHLKFDKGNGHLPFIFIHNSASLFCCYRVALPPPFLSLSSARLVELPVKKHILSMIFKPERRLFLVYFLFSAAEASRCHFNSFFSYYHVEPRYIRACRRNADGSCKTDGPPDQAQGHGQT